MVANAREDSSNPKFGLGMGRIICENLKMGYERAILLVNAANLP
jgi:hypothetical protein